MRSKLEQALLRRTKLSDEEYVLGPNRDAESKVNYGNGNGILFDEPPPAPPNPTPCLTLGWGVISQTTNCNI
jgi:hypothetical protein